MSENTEARDVADLAVASVEPHELDPTLLHSVIVPADGQQRIIDLEYALPRPRRAAGTTVLRDVPSFVAYFQRFGTEDVFLYADRDSGVVTAVFDDDEVDADASLPLAGWRGRRAELRLQHTVEWLAWTGADKKLMGQRDFAEHLEANRAEIIRPDSAALLELVQDFEVNTKVSFKSSERLDSGRRALIFVEEDQPTKKGSIEIPTSIDLGIAVYQGALAREAITAQFRHRIVDGQLKLAYVLDRPAEKVDAAFEGICQQLQEQTGATVLAGRAAASR